MLEFRYDAVIFDVGGTLIGFHDPEPFRQFLAEANLPATDEEARQFHRRLMAVIQAGRDGAQGLGAEGAELYAWWQGIFHKAWPDRPDLAEKMLRWLFAGRFDRLFADVIPALEALRGMGLTLGVLSNFGLHLGDLLERLGLRRFFQFVVVSAEEKVAKPNPRIFDIAVEQAGLARARLLYVGDHLGDDIGGARGAGLDAVLIDRDDRQAGALCPRIHSLLELVEYVRPPARPAPAIAFDMDGTVLDSMPVHLFTWQRTLAPLGIALTAADLYPLEGVPTEPTAQRLTEKFLGRPCPAEEARRLAETKWALFLQVFRPTFVPGMVPLLHDLRGRGYRLGLVTDSARRVVEECLTPAVAGLFDVIVSGDQVSRGKPDPEPYRLAAEGLGFPPGACLAVENAPLGIRSAKGAGMACVALTTTLPAGQLADAGADQIFADAQALRAWLLAHWAGRLAPER